VTHTPDLAGPSSVPVIPVVFGPVPPRPAHAPFPDIVTQGFAATLTAPRWARRHAAAVLADWGLSELEPVVVQIVSELVANAATRPVVGGAVPYVVRLTLRLLPHRIGIEVFDPDPAAPVLIQAANDDERGRGLAIVRALSCGLGIVPLDDGKLVIAQVRRPTRLGGVR
jgi:anti-sigma regulatory factor (Ser/Thr protein kinase)